MHGVSMSTFGDLLRKYRQQSTDPTTKKPLSQKRLADLLVEAAGFSSLSGVTISNWERGKYQIHKDDRTVLVALLQIFCMSGGIQSLEDANQLLFAGNYRPLTPDECKKINPIWSQQVIFSTSHLVFSQQQSEDATPSPADLISSRAEQGVTIRPPNYTQLFGVDAILDALYQRILTDEDAKILALVGLGGIGKTALADAVVRRVVQTTHFHRVIWLTNDAANHSESVLPIANTLDNFILNLGEQLFPDILDRKDARRRFIQVQHELKAQRYLVVLDNLEDAVETESLLAYLHALIRPSQFLITSRHRPPISANVAVFPLQTLSIKPAVALLRHQAALANAHHFDTLTDDELAEWCNMVGGHPLALRLLPHLTRTQSLSQIRAGWRQGQAGYITDTYNWIYQRIWESLQEHEKRLLQVMFLVATPGATTSHLQAISQLDEVAFWYAIQALDEQALLEQRGNLDTQRIGIHRLTEQFLESRLAQANVTSHPFPQPFTDSIIANLLYWQQQVTRPDESAEKTIAQERLNIWRAIQFGLMLPNENVTDHVLHVWHTLAQYIYSFVEQFGYALEWISLLNQLISRYKSAGGRPITLLNQLGNLYRMQRQLSLAIATHLEAQELAYQEEREDEVGRVALNLGWDYLRNRNHVQAARQGQLALNILSQSTEPRLELASALSLMGLVARAKDQPDLAEKQFLAARNILSTLAQPTELARLLNNLAILYEEQHQVEAAIACYRDANAALSQTNNRLDRILLALSEGTLYYNQKRLGEAEATFATIDRHYLQQAGHYFYEALLTNNLGAIALAKGDAAQAEVYLRESDTLWQQVDDNLRRANTLESLCQALRQQGNHAAALAACATALHLLSAYANNEQAAKLRRQLLAHQQQLEAERDNTSAASPS